ncbi:MAG: glycosyltransferase [Bacilli bacterium]|nr:glycosyltransferase [Bacilli bacterium]
MKNKVSIIIPVYNAVDYIERCINSVLAQSFSNFELILINDGSTDNSLEVINSYAAKDSRIKVFSQGNHGVAYTRNYGISLATGKYVMFIDNDDYIADDYVMKFYKEIEEGNYDVVVGGYERVDTNDKVIKRVVLKNYNWSKYMIVAPWAKIYRTNFIKENNIQFLESNIGEDIYFNAQVMNLTTKIKIINNTSYKWFYNDFSISNTVHRKANKSLQFEFLLDSVYRKLENINFSDRELIEYFFIKTICWFIFYINKDNDLKLVCMNMDKYIEWLNNKFPNYQKNKYLSLFRPKGEFLKNRLGVYILIKGYKFKFHNLVLKILK